MGGIDHDRLPEVTNRRGMLQVEAHPGGQTKQRRRRTEPDLEIAGDVFSDEAIRALVDDWLVPAIVDGLIRDLTNPAVGETR